MSSSPATAGEGYAVVPKGGIIMWAAPIALNEIFLAIWLIIKGFNSSVVAAHSTETDMA